MAFPLDPDALIALDNSRANARYMVTARYGVAQTIPSADHPNYDVVPITTDGQFSFDSSAQIQASGSLFVSSDGESLIPQGMDSPLAPFGQELQIDYQLLSGGQSWRIPMGVYRIVEVPSWDETFRQYPKMRYRDGWSVQINFSDRFDRISAAKFLGPTGPTSGSTCLVEAAKLAAGAGVSSSWPTGLADASIPSGITYESDRLDAISQLLAAVNCDPAMTRQGALTALPRNRWIGASKDDADIQIDGVVSFQGGMSGDVYNAVVFSNDSANLTPGVAMITDESNPLAVSRPIGLRVYTASSPLMDTRAKLDAAARTTLASVSKQQAQSIQISGLPRPDVDLGDIVWARDNASGREAIGQLVSFQPAGFNPTGAWTYNLTGVELT